MIRQAFDVNGFWRVTVFYELDCNFLYSIENELLDIGFSSKSIHEVFQAMCSGKAKAVTCSSLKYHTSIVIFNSHDSKTDYINSIVHEAEHVKQAMLNAYHVEDSGEPPAYTIGYLVGKMWEVISKMICCS